MPKRVPGQSHRRSPPALVLADFAHGSRVPSQCPGRMMPSVSSSVQAGAALAAPCSWRWVRMHCTGVLWSSPTWWVSQEEADLLLSGSCPMHPTPQQSWDKPQLWCPSSLGGCTTASPPQTFCSWVEKSSRKRLVQLCPSPHSPSKRLGVEKGILQEPEPVFKGIV